MHTETQTFVREAVLTYRRHRGVRVPTGDAPLTDDRLASDLFRRLIPDGPAERFVVVALDTQGQPQAWATIGIGGLASCSVEIATVLRFVLLAGCARFLCAHNHPSGRVHPSGDDIALTRRLADGARTVGIELLDHLVITHNDHFSFRSSGML